MEIATTTETVTINKYTITLTDAELAAALVDPAPMQQALRDARGQQAKGRHGKRNLTFVRKAGKKEPAAAATPKAITGKRSKAGAFTKEPCAKCGKPIARPQMGRHLQACQGSAAAETA